MCAVLAFLRVMLHCLHVGISQDMQRPLHNQEPLAIMLVSILEKHSIIIFLDNMNMILSSLAAMKVFVIRVVVRPCIAITENSCLYREIPSVSMDKGHHTS
jgi:hypothetical protein